MKHLTCVLFGSLLLLVGCGGGGGGSTSTSSSTPTSSTPTPVNGVFAGTYTSTTTSGPTHIYGAIESGGFGYFADTTGNVFVLPGIAQSGSFSGTMTAYAPPGSSFQNGSTVAQFSLTGSATASSITGSFSGGGDNGSFTLSSQSNQPPTISALAGTYDGSYFGSNNSSINVTIGSDGSVSGSDSSGCGITGKVSVDSQGLLKVAATSTCSGALSGLGFASSSDLSGAFSNAAGTYAYFGVSGSQQAYAMELKHQ